MTVDVMKKLYRWGMYNPIHMLLNTAHYKDLFGHSNISDHYDITIRRNTELASDPCGSGLFLAPPSVHLLLETDRVSLQLVRII